MPSSKTDALRLRHERSGRTLTILRLPQQLSAHPHSDTRSAALLRARGRAVRAGTINRVCIANPRRWFAMWRTGLYWMRPHVGTDLAEVPVETQFLLWQRTDGTYGVLLPLIEGDVRATVRGASDATLSFSIAGALPGEEPPETTVALVAIGTDPFALASRATELASRYLGTFRPRNEKSGSAYADQLGWCTWDAFYHTVDEKKVMNGLRSFQRGGVVPGFVILDDGWLATTGDFLDSAGPNRTKFTEGLTPMIRKAKQRFGVKVFGIHHPFQGYWAGVNPRGELGKRFQLVKNRQNIRPWLGEQKSDLYLIHPSQVARFYSEFYENLRRQGVDFVKVDGQSALELFTRGKLGRVSTMKAYQEALQGAAALYFRGDVIQCMCHGSDVIFHMGACNGWRNTHDYFPKRPAETQQAHVWFNAMNNVWNGTFSVPDWDMFQSHSVGAEFHAAARAISGGPVYVCDKPGRQNFDILRKLCTSTRTVLRCPQPALPTRDCLFVDCLNSPRLLKVANTNRNIGVLGIFHCYQKDRSLATRFRASDIPTLDGNEFAVYAFASQSLSVLNRRDSGSVELGRMGFELFTVSPVREGVAPLGLIDKYNGSRAVLDHQIVDKAHAIRVLDGGRIGLYCRRKPKRVSANGKRCRIRYTSKTGLLVVEAHEGTETRIELHS